jgi:uncharacterized protein (DUF427 family)
MGMMTGNGPLGREPAGRFNFEPPAPGEAMYVEPTPKRIRVLVAGETIADSRRAMLVHESGHQPVYYFPAEDLRADLLEPSARRTHCAKKGEATYQTIRVGETVVKDGAWCYPDPVGSAEALRGLVAFYWNRMDAWFEEDEEVFVHPRDPYHRVDVRATSRHVQVSLDGRPLADTTRATALFESNLPTRWYLPREDVVAELVPSETSTGCPYKGFASYYSVRMATGDILKDLVWFYPDPLPEAGAIKDLVCFFNERVDITLDGERLARPASPWSSGVHAAAQNLPPAETRG